MPRLPVRDAPGDWRRQAYILTLNPVNNPRTERPLPHDTLGPAPADEATSSSAGMSQSGMSQSGMSASRRALLADLRSRSQPATLAVLSTATGLHVNTVREHLAALVSAGLAVRSTSAPDGRGRPAATYAASIEDHALVRAEYAGLAAALASTIRRTSSTPSHDATVAGAEWGQELARTSSRTPEDDADPRTHVVTLLTQLGFAPEPGGQPSTTLLTRCPLLSTAQAYPDVVCAVHLGIVQGVLDVHGAGDATAELFPFSDPGACRLELSVTSPGGARPPARRP